MEGKILSENTITNEIKEIMKKVDHTLLKPESKEEDIKKLCDEALKYETASVCIPPAFVKYVSDYLKGNSAGVKVCTVIGFPLGYNSTFVKVQETIDAVKSGADEIDMVINIGKLKEKNYDYVLNEIKEIKSACDGRILKVIIETCLLTEEEKIKMCEIVTEAEADFIKTSTGFSTAGATFDDVSLFKKYVGENVKIKAAGGIKDFKDAEKFVSLGADRLGTSRLVKILEDI